MKKRFWLLLCIIGIGLSSLTAEPYRFLNYLLTIRVPFAYRLNMLDNTLYVYGDSLLTVFTANNINKPSLQSVWVSNDAVKSFEPLPSNNLIAVGPMNLQLREIDSLNISGKRYTIKTFRGDDSARQGSILFVGQERDGLEIYDLGRGNQSKQLSSYHESFGIRKLVSNWPMVYGLNPYGLVVIDASNLESPVTRNKNYYITDATDLTVRDTIVVVGTRFDMRVISVADPKNPRELSQVRFPHPVETVKIQDNFAYICTGEGGLRIYDITRPRQPRELNTYFGDDRAFDIAFNGSYLYLADGRGGVKVFLYH